MNTTKITSADLLDRALEQETQAQQILFDQITDRARVDDRFRQRLQTEPEKAVREVAESLKTKTPSKLNEAVINQATEKVRALVSTALPGIEEMRVANMVFTTIEDARCSFNLSLRLTQVLFYAGLVMIAATFVVALVVDAKQIPVLIFGGGGGVLGVVSALLVNPIDRVQNAAGNLVQIEVAFLSYYKQISLLSPPIDQNSPKIALHYSEEVRKAMAETLALIETYCEYRNKATAKPDEK